MTGRLTLSVGRSMKKLPSPSYSFGTLPLFKVAENCISIKYQGVEAMLF